MDLDDTSNNLEIFLRIIWGTVFIQDFRRQNHITAQRQSVDISVK